MAMTKETWKPLAGTNNTYEISNRGHIRSWIKRGPFKATLDEKPHAIKTYFQGKAEYVNVPLEGKMHVCSLRKLMLEAYPDVKLHHKPPVAEEEVVEKPPKRVRSLQLRRSRLPRRWRRRKTSLHGGFPLRPSRI